MKKRKQMTLEEELHFMQGVIGRMLQVGVVLSASVVIIGAIVYFTRHGLLKPNYNAFTKEEPGLRSLPGIGRGVLTFDGKYIMQLGLVLLISTPIARVAFSVYTFARERDRLYTIFTLIVLALLGYSLLFSR